MSARRSWRCCGSQSSILFSRFVRLQKCFMSCNRLPVAFDHRCKATRAPNPAASTARTPEKSSTIRAAPWHTTTRRHAVLLPARILPEQWKMVTPSRFWIVKLGIGFLPGHANAQLIDARTSSFRHRPLAGGAADTQTVSNRTRALFGMRVMLLS
jgi:hypothetical protein